MDLSFESRVSGFELERETRDSRPETPAFSQARASRPLCRFS
jgi:hypothetical protein